MLQKQKRKEKRKISIIPTAINVTSHVLLVLLQKVLNYTKKCGPAENT